MPFSLTHPALASALTARGYAEPTPVQAAVLAADPLRDLIVSAQTGSGKTVAYGLALARAKRIDPEIFDLFPVLKEMLGRRGGDLSGGQQQQLAIARAMVADPKLIILDEPTEGIQPSIIKDIERVIRMLRERGDMAIVLCEQYFDFARALADQFVVLSRGAVVRAGERAEMEGDEVRELLSV